MFINKIKTALNLSIIAFVISSSAINFAVSKNVKTDYPVPEYKRGLTDHFISWLNQQKVFAQKWQIYIEDYDQQQNVITNANHLDKSVKLIGDSMLADFAKLVQSFLKLQNFILFYFTWTSHTNRPKPFHQIFSKGFWGYDFFGGSFGGKDSDDTPITKRPVIFVHGNADMAIGDEWVNNGFRLSIEYFLSRGYTKAELYASQWGFADVPHEFLNIDEPGHVIQQEWVMQIRKFVEAVLEYTQAPQIDIISHSFGVTFSRRIIKGGLVFGDTHPYYIGEPLNKRHKQLQSISLQNGGYPGDEDAQPYPKNMSLALLELNVNPIKEAEHTYAIFSVYDSPIMFSRSLRECNQFKWPTMDASHMFTTPEYDHVGSRDLSAEMQYNLVTYHSFDEPEFNNQDGQIDINTLEQNNFFYKNGNNVKDNIFLQ